MARDAGLCYEDLVEDIGIEKADEEVEKRIINLEAEIKKIVLGWIGEDKEENITEEGKEIWSRPNHNYNKAKAEIRKKVEGEL